MEVRLTVILANARTAVGSDAATLWEGYTIDRKRRILRVLPETFVIHPPGRGVRTFNPDTVEIRWSR